MRIRLLAYTVAFAVLAAVAVLAADERIDYEVNARIRAEGRERSQLMRTLHVLTDLHGPRLTGSPNHKAAAEWAIGQMRGWGFENAHLEPWDFGHSGWLNERFSGHILSPVKDSLVGEVLAWTPSTNGTATGRAVRIDPPRCQPAASAALPGARNAPNAPSREQCPSQEDLTAWFARTKDAVKGRMVLVGAPTKVPVTFDPPSLRRDDETVRRQYDLNNPAPSPFAVQQEPQRETGRLSANQINEQVDQFLLSSGALVRINDGGRDHGQIRAFNNRTFDPAKTVPTVILRNEDYGRISRILDDSLPVELEFTIVNRMYPEGRTSYNAIAEIPGTDKRNEVVMLGGHLDSWHAATGATDNAIGCSVMIEAARILKAIGVKPRRTIRVALWSGEEQGLLGSKAYVKEHFGTFENPKLEYATFNGYFNVDSGTGRVRGASVFGPKAAGEILQAALAPFEDFGIAGASATRSRRSGGTDSTSFNEAGLPGIGLGQDPIQYQTHTWHTNLDTYERVHEPDVIRNAIAVAGAVYHLAMRDEMLPRFSKADMPEPPRPAQQTTTAGSAPAVKVVKDVDYVAGASYADGKDRLDIYAREGVKNAPVLVVFHGGGLTAGDRSGMAAAGQRFARAGFVAVPASYRLSPGVSHPAHIQDAAAAVAWVKKNIQQYGGDPNKVFVAGYSAGAYLTALLASDGKYLAAHQVSLKDIRGVIPVAGFFWVDREGVAPDRPKEIWGTDPRAWVNASPAKHFGRHVPPALLIIGDRDDPWRIRQNAEAAPAVRAAGQPDLTHILVKDRNHQQIWGGIGNEDDEVAVAIISFVNRLSGRSTSN